MSVKNITNRGARLAIRPQLIVVGSRKWHIQADKQNKRKRKIGEGGKDKKKEASSITVV